MPTELSTFSGKITGESGSVPGAGVENSVEIVEYILYILIFRQIMSTYLKIRHWNEKSIFLIFLHLGVDFFLEIYYNTPRRELDD